MKPAKPRKKTGVVATPAAKPEALLTELRELILSVRSQVAQTVNAGLTLLYWQVGDRIRREILKEKRAEYGAEIVAALSRQLEIEFGRGFSEKSLRHMIRFAEAFPDVKIVSSLLRQLSWTHFLSILYLKDPFQRDFYAEMCRIERWSTRTLQERIQSMLYERTALSKKPKKLIEQELKTLRDEDRLTWLNRHERQPGEEKPLGLILCAGKKAERVEYLDLDRDGVHLAEYLTELPPRELLQQRLHEAVVYARARLEQRAADAEPAEPTAASKKRRAK